MIPACPITLRKNQTINQEGVPVWLLCCLDVFGSRTYPCLRREYLPSTNVALDMT